MSPIDTNALLFEIIKGVVVAVAGWVLKMHTDMKALRRDLDCAFGKIRELQGPPKDSH